MIKVGKYMTDFYWSLAFLQFVHYYIYPTWMNVVVLTVICVFLWLHRLEDWNNRD